MRNISLPTALIISSIILGLSIMMHAALLKSEGITLKSFALGKKSEEAKPSPTPPTPENEDTIVDVSVDDDPALGNENAKVTIIEFSDFECPFCKRLYDDTIVKLKEEYVNTGKVRLVYRDYPLAFHANAQISAEAGECADEQGKFWQFHDKLFESQSEWSGGTNDNAKTKFADYARALGLDVNKFTSCVDIGKYKDEVKKDLDDGNSAGISGTPTLIINGRKMVGAQPYATFKAVIDEELSK